MTGRERTEMYILLRLAVGASLVLLGLAISSGYISFAVLLAFAPIGICGAVFGTTRAPWDSRRVSERLAIAATYAFLIGGLVLRVRSTSAIEEQAVDAAGGFRLLLNGVAATFALASILASRGQGLQLPKALRVYIAYVAAAIPGIVVATSPSLAAFKFAELALLLLVVVANLVAFRGTARAALQASYRFVWALVLTVVVGVVLSPGQALFGTGGILPFRLTGVLPVLSANTVGLLGLVLLAGSTGQRRPRVWQACGVALVVLSQYRTGYVALALLAFTVAAIKRDMGARVAGVTVICAGLLLTQSASFEEAWTRGSTDQQVETLSSRTVFWGEAIRTTSRSPLVGLGLSSGTRLDVLSAQLGRDATSTIHSTWIEAFVGTGLLGASLLALSMGVGVAAALRHRRSPGGFAILSLLLILLVRSMTGSSIELAGFPAALFLFGVSSLCEDRDRAAPTRAGVFT